MDTTALRFQDRVKAVRGRHEGRTGTVVQIIPGHPVVGVRFHDRPAQPVFVPATELVKWSEGSGERAA